MYYDDHNLPHFHADRDNTSCLDIDPDTLYELPNVKERIA